MSRKYALICEKKHRVLGQSTDEVRFVEYLNLPESLKIVEKDKITRKFKSIDYPITNSVEGVGFYLREKLYKYIDYHVVEIIPWERYIKIYHNVNKISNDVLNLLIGEENIGDRDV